MYVEVYDDTDSSCYHALNGSADPNASYETSYYGKVGLQSQYRAYYQAPNQPKQYLAWGNFTYYYSNQHAVGEVFVRPEIPALLCPALGYTSMGQWNHLGTSSSTTFASTLQIVVPGSGWTNWTPSSAPYTLINYDAPYSLVVDSSYSQIRNGGGG